MTKLLCSLAIFAWPFTASAQSGEAPEIRWPAAYEPAASKFYVHNEIAVHASPEKVWAFLVDALRWESWYSGARDVSYLNPRDTVLNAGSVFEWRTMGLCFTSSVKEMVPNRYLAWESKKKSIQGYHVWLIVPAEKGCTVITDESQNGWLTFFEKTFQGKKLKRLHDVWLAELKKKAESAH